MGGALALHFAYRYCTDLAGVFALSSFLGEKSSVYEVTGFGIFHNVDFCCVQVIVRFHHYCPSCTQTEYECLKKTVPVLFCE